MCNANIVAGDVFDFFLKNLKSQEIKNENQAGFFLLIEKKKKNNPNANVCSKLINIKKVINC